MSHPIPLFVLSPSTSLRINFGACIKVEAPPPIMPFDFAQGERR